VHLFFVVDVGFNCSENINECESVPCQYNGTCVDLVNGYRCECIAGITGTNCETNIDDCRSEPCLYGGRCNDLINGYCYYQTSLDMYILLNVNIFVCFDLFRSKMSSLLPLVSFTSFMLLWYFSFTA